MRYIGVPINYFNASRNTDVPMRCAYEKLWRKLGTPPARSIDISDDYVVSAGTSGESPGVPLVQ